MAIVPWVTVRIVASLMSTSPPVWIARLAVLVELGRRRRRTAARRPAWQLGPVLGDWQPLAGGRHLDFALGGAGESWPRQPWRLRARQSLLLAVTLASFVGRSRLPELRPWSRRGRGRVVVLEVPAVWRLRPFPVSGWSGWALLLRSQGPGGVSSLVFAAGSAGPPGRVRRGRGRSPVSPAGSQLPSDAAASTAPLVRA